LRETGACVASGCNSSSFSSSSSSSSKETRAHGGVENEVPLP
jgi:hypothetical protein